MVRRKDESCLLGCSNFLEKLVSEHSSGGLHTYFSFCGNRRDIDTRYLKGDGSFGAFCRYELGVFRAFHTDGVIDVAHENSVGRVDFSYQIQHHHTVDASGNTEYNTILGDDFVLQENGSKCIDEGHRWVIHKIFFREFF